MESDNRRRLIRLYITTIRGDIFRLEDLAADIENNHPVNSPAIIREIVDSLIDNINKITFENDGV